MPYRFQGLLLDVVFLYLLDRKLFKAWALHTPTLFLPSCASDKVLKWRTVIFRAIVVIRWLMLKKHGCRDIPEIVTTILHLPLYLDNILRITTLFTLHLKFNFFVKDDSCDSGKLTLVVKCDTSFFIHKQGYMYFASLYRSKFDTILFCLAWNSVTTG